MNWIVGWLMHIREYAPDDRKAVLEIFDSNVGSGLAFNKGMRGYIENYLCDPLGQYYVLEQDGEVVASGGIVFQGEDNVWNLFYGMVHKAAQRMGLGSLLLNWRLDAVDVSESEFVALNTTLISQGFYLKHGFEVHEIHQDEYGFGKHEIYMMKDLSIDADCI